MTGEAIWMTKAEILEVVNLYYHVVDELDTSRLREVFSPDCTIDMTEFGRGITSGIDAILASFDRPSPRPVRAHMGTNTRISLEGDEALSVTKCIAMLEGGTVGVALHLDRLRQTEEGWRNYERRIALPPQLKAAAG